VTGGTGQLHHVTPDCPAASSHSNSHGYLWLAPAAHGFCRSSTTSSIAR
jgi:hypothetical protein